MVFSLIKSISGIRRKFIFGGWSIGASLGTRSGRSGGNFQKYRTDFEKVKPTIRFFFTSYYDTNKKP